MYNFIKTDDESIGIYSESANDILHSRTGALREANEKFVDPALVLLSKKNDLKILDICTGAGYNLKAVIKKLLNKQAVVDCVDINADFIFLSIFLKDAIDDDSLKIFILSEILRNGFKIADIYNYLISLEENAGNDFFNASISFLIKKLFDEGYEYNLKLQNLSFLHNIYYKYISKSMKYDLKINEYSNIKINYKIMDARLFIKNSLSHYDVIFLDGFSPQKDPSLWTIDFLNQLKNKMNPNSILTSYSKSTPFRSALYDLGFFVGKTYIDNIDMGTVASFDEDNIKNKLDDNDFKLIATRSGIHYKDPGLSLSKIDIIKNREFEQNSSNRISHTSFLKSKY